MKCTSKNGDTVRIGIYANQTEKTFCILCHSVSGLWHLDLFKDLYNIEKTGKHFDIQSMLDEIG